MNLNSVQAWLQRSFTLSTINLCVFLFSFLPLTSAFLLSLLVRPRYPAPHTERSQHDFHCQRAKDESHYAHQDRRALSTDHAQNRIGKKQQKIGQEDYHHHNNSGLDPLRNRINIIIGQDDRRHDRSSPGDGRHRQREHREIAPFLWRAPRFLVHFPEKHLQTEQEQNDAAGHFERVHMNTDRVENDLADGHGNHEENSGVNASTQRRPMPLCPAERSGQPGEKRQGRDRVDRREERSKILANLDQERRHRSYLLVFPSYFFLLWVRFSLIRRGGSASTS